MESQCSAVRRGKKKISSDSLDQKKARRERDWSLQEDTASQEGRAETAADKHGCNERSHALVHEHMTADISRWGFNQFYDSHL